jgi:hypothetical protein
MVNRRRRVWLTVVAAIAVPLLAACTGGRASAGPSSATHPPTQAGPQSASTSPSAASDLASSRAPQSPSGFQPTGLQVVEVAHVKNFVRAYNAGNLAGTLAQFSRVKALHFSDCDYSTQQLVDGNGRAALTAWLRQSLADHDRLTIGDMAVSPPDQVGVLGVAFSRRSGDAIALAGHASGITPSVGAKIKFDNAGLITEFNNGPYGGPQDGCRLR